MSDQDCGDPDCEICFPLVTKTGRLLTADDIQALAEEAEIGYNFCEHEDYVEAETTGVLIRRCGKCQATTVAAPGLFPDPLPLWLVTIERESNDDTGSRS